MVSPSDFVRWVSLVSTVVKEEVQGAAFDLLPTVIGIGGMIFGVMLFKNHSEKTAKSPMIPGYSQITITTNNYYFGGGFGQKHEEEDEDNE